MFEVPVLHRLGGWAENTGCADALTSGDVHTAAQRPVLTVAAGDHPVARPGDDGESALSDLRWGHGPEEADRIAAGTSVLNEFADLAGCVISVADVSDADPSSSGVNEWVEAGRQAADSHADAAVPMLLAGSVGVGATTSAAAVIGVFCDVEPVKVVGRGTRTGQRHGISDEKWKAKTLAVRDIMFPARPCRRRPASEAKAQTVLDLAATPDIAYLTGLLSQAAVRRTPVVLDGISTLAAGLLAEALTPGASRWWLAPHLPGEPASAPALRSLSLHPVIGSDLGTPGAAAGMSVLPLLASAVLTVRRS